MAQSDATAALTAIVQMLMAEVYRRPGHTAEEVSMREFRALAAQGDPLACAIVNVLTETEIEQALGAPQHAHATHEDALRALPVYPYLTDEQRERAHRLRIAEDAADEAGAA